MAIGIALFVLTPSVLVGWLPKIGTRWRATCWRARCASAMFLGYIQLIARMDAREAAVRLPRRRAQGDQRLGGDGSWPMFDVAPRQSTIHPRCGTNFVLTVLMVKVLLASFFGWPVLVAARC